MPRRIRVRDGVRTEGIVQCPPLTHSLQLQWLPGTGTPCGGGWGVSCLYSFYNEHRCCLSPYTQPSPPTQPANAPDGTALHPLCLRLDRCFQSIWAQLCLWPTAHCLGPGGDAESGHLGFQPSKHPQCCNPARSTPAGHKDQERPGELGLTCPYLCRAEV